MSKKFFWIFGLLLLIVTLSQAQNIQLTGSSKPVVGIGETFYLTYTVNAQGENFKGPSIRGLDILSGPFTSTSSNIAAINGKTSMTISCTYSYILRGNAEGTFEIPPASVTVSGRQYQSNSVTIKVVKNEGSGQNQSQGGAGGTGNSQNAAGVQSSSNDVFVKAFISNANPLQGEGINVTYKLFFKVNVGNLNITKEPSFPGFWTQKNAGDNTKAQTYKQVIDGQTYMVVDIRKYMLYPLKSGKMTIDPIELECVAQIKRQTRSKTGDPFFDDFFNDSFFNNSYANVEKSLRSNALVVNVRPLPTAEKPVDFSGAVGTFTFTTELDKTHVSANDAINLKCAISGKGNIQLIDKLNVSFPPDFETYDPKISSNFNSATNNVSGSQTFEYLIIPRKAGKFTIKPITFSYFDLEKKKYVSVSSPEYTIDVDKGTGEGTSVTYSGAGKEDIKYIGSDIRHIRNLPFSLQPTGTIFFASRNFYLFLLLPLVLFILVIIFWKKQEVRRSDTVLMKNRKATRVAIRRLKKANGFLKEQKQEAFYIEISQALWGYLSDKFGIPLAGLSIDSVREALVQKNVSEDIIRQFIETLNNTEFARFAPGEKAMIMEKTYNEALEIITRIERELK
jgi:hypothetical protein